MTRATYMVGDVFDRLGEIPDGSVDLVMTSPPFLALRSYLPAGHPDKGKEIGQEPTPAAFIDTMLALTAEWRRVLAPHGSIAVELGDTYSGSGGAGGDYADSGNRHSQPEFAGSAKAARRYQGAIKMAKEGTSSRMQSGDGWPLAKSMVGIPHLYHLSLAYGRNLLRERFTATEAFEWVDRLRASGMSADAALAAVGGWVAEHGPVHRFEPWRVRNVVAWVRPNPPVGALGDKFRPATSYLTIACVSQRRYFDLDAVRGDYNERKVVLGKVDTRDAARAEQGLSSANGNKGNNPAGAPPLDWWEIPTQPYSGSHYATFPEALVVRPIEAMCPRKVCTTCGQPSERIVETTNAIGEATGRRTWREDGTDGIGAGHVGAITRSSSSAPTAERLTLGWTDCGHDTWRPGVVLDPFAGSGTTLAVATARGRDAIGIDLDERNLDLARQRIGMWLQEVPA